ncbi:hypothetical protein DSL72_001882 [Monilinia vaccinii-corymbosi]|uniref:Uncharacterized protein n=1 Tax=Monilinia vaccinii-corymbosi TaxID=61207 RepID=A0A8A3PB39_9HELO|nr:hypothetical protein DSL72_001882 [Monilinia vaccinii-corymbosi]
MDEADLYDFINTNNEFLTDMESAINQFDVDGTQEQQPEHHPPAPSFNPLGTFPFPDVEIPGPADFALYLPEYTEPQGEQVAQTSTDAQFLNNNTNNDPYSLDTFSNGEPFLGSYTDMLDLNGLDPYFGYQVLFGESEQSAEQQPATEQDRPVQSEQDRPVQPEQYPESQSSEDKIKTPLNMPNIFPSMCPSKNIDPNLDLMDSFWMAGLPTPTDFNARLDAGTGGQKAVPKLPDFPTGRAPDISVMINTQNNYVNTNNNNDSNSNSNSNSNINPNVQEQVNFNMNSIGDQGYENQRGNVSSTRGENATGLYPMVTNQSHRTDMANQFQFNPGSGYHNTVPTIATPLPRASAQEQSYQDAQSSGNRFQTTVYPPPPEINQQRYFMGGPQNAEKGYRNPTSSPNFLNRHQWASEAAAAIEQISRRYGAPNPWKRARVEDEEEQPPVSRKRPRSGTAPARTQRGMGRVDRRFEPIPGNQSPQDFDLNRRRREPTFSASYPPRGTCQPESNMANRSIYAGLGNGYRQFSAPTRMRPEGYMNISRSDPGYMPLPPPPNNLRGHMEPQMFHQQTSYHTNNAGMNRTLPRLPGLVPSTPPAFIDNNRGPPLNGHYSTNLTEQVTRPAVQENPSNEKPIKPEEPWMAGVIPVTRRGRRMPVNAESSNRAERKSSRPMWECRLESYYPRVWMLEEEAKMVEKNYDKNPRKAFQNMSNAKNNMKSIQLDWDQVELLNSIRQAARNVEEERRKLCKPEEYIAKEIPSDYKPKARLLQCYNAWLEAKQEGGMVSNSWTNRKRRTADNRTYKPAKEEEGQEDESSEPILRASPQSSALAQPGNSPVQNRKRGRPQGKFNKSDAEEPAAKKPREQ